MIEVDLSEPADFFDANGVYIHYRVLGTGDPPQVLLHGFGASLETYADVARDLAGLRRLVLVDLKGFGRSSRVSDGKYSPSDQAALVLSLVASLGIVEFGVVGHSYGALVAFEIYRSLDESGAASRISSFLLLDPPGRVDRLPFFVRRLRIPLVSRIALDVLPPSILAGYTLKRLFSRPSRITPRIRARYERGFSHAGSAYSFRQAALQIVPSNADRLLKDLSKISAPALLIRGDNDPIFPSSDFQALHRMVGTSRTVVVGDCGHIPHEECPDSTLPSMMEFLSGRRPQ